MSSKIQKPGEFIGDIWFPVLRERFSKIPLWPIFIKGYGITVLLIMGVRCLFFVGADFAEGEVKYLTYNSTGKMVIKTTIFFKTKQGREVYVNAKRELYLKLGDRVTMVYKVDNPERAIVFNYAGFWVNSVIFCGITLLFWIGFPLAFYGFNDKMQ